jgi:hypothetical protein
MIAAATKQGRVTKQQQWDSGTRRPAMRPERELPQEESVVATSKDISKSKATAFTVRDSLKTITDTLTSVVDVEQQKLQLLARSLEPASAGDELHTRMSTLEKTQEAMKSSLANVEQGQSQILSLLHHLASQRP